MKPHLPPALLVAVSLLTLGCSSSSEPEGAPMTARINGVDWAAEAVITSAQYNVAAELLVLAGLNTTSYTIGINIADVTAPGTIALTNTFPLRFAVVNTNDGGSWSSTLAGGSGTVTISTFTDTRVTGTFSFTAVPSLGSTDETTLTVTTGQFDMPVTRLNAP